MRVEIFIAIGESAAKIDSALEAPACLIILITLMSIREIICFRR